MFLHIFFSRIIILVTQTYVNWLIPDHDAQAFTHLQSDLKKERIDIAVWNQLGGFLRWDAQYFYHIAKYGYTFENTLAFLPMYPLTVRKIARLLDSTFPIMNEDSWLLVVFVFLNISLFVTAAAVLFSLSKRVLNSYDLAYKATIFFCFNPASIFFSAPYTEALYAFLSFSGMFACVLFHLKYRRVFAYRFWGLVYVSLFSAATFTRSNGVLNCGFIVFYAVKLCVHRIRYVSTEKCLTVFRYAVVAVVLCVVAVLPFVLFQIYGYYAFCKDFASDLPEKVVGMAHAHDFVLPGNVSRYNQSWCFDRIPLAYSYVQRHYWNVGFLKYYEIKQIPNFLLASPIVLIILYYSSIFFKQHYRNLFSYVFAANNYFLAKRVEKEGHFTIDMFPFVVHAVFLTVFNVLTINVQVTTRILCSASPVLYWYCAYLFKDVCYKDFSLFWNWRCQRKQILMKLYFLSYYFIGTVMFCNFLPWT